MEKINDSLVMMDFMNKSVYIILNSQLFRNIDFQPVFQTCETRGGHHVAVLNVAREQLVGLVQVAADLHLVEGNLTVFIDIDVAVAGALLTEDGLVGDNHVLLRAEVDGHAGVHARAYTTVGVGQLNLHGESVRGAVHRRVNQTDFALELLFTVSVHLDTHRRADLHLLEQGFGEVDLHLHGGDLLNRYHGQTAEEVATVVVTGTDNSRNRTD